MESATTAPRIESRLASQILGLLGWLALCLVAGWFGSQFEPGTWYQGLEKPSFNPPSSVFAPVWIMLYLAMATAAWRIWRRFGFSGARIALTLFLIQIVLNAMWSWIFFGLHRIGIAFAELLVLWIVILTTTAAFWQKDKVAGILMVPYAAWVTFAAVLNFSIWQLNSTG